MTSLILNRAGNTPLERALDSRLNDIGRALDRRKDLYKVVVVANHFFRTTMVLGFMAVLPFTPAVSALVSFSASVGYRATIERFCQFRFAVLSCVGAFAFKLSAPSIALIVHGLALASIKTFVLTVLGVIPALLYLATVVWVSNKSVNDYLRKKVETSCCGRSESPSDYSPPLESSEDIDYNSSYRSLASESGYEMKHFDSSRSHAHASDQSTSRLPRRMEAETTLI